MSVLVSPRLNPPATHLGEVKEFRDWPKTLRETVLPSLQIKWDGPAEAVNPQLDTRSAVADSILWSRLFPPSTPVHSTPRQVDTIASTADLLLRSFPARMVHDRVNALYRDVGVAVVGRRLPGPPTVKDAAETPRSVSTQSSWPLPRSGDLGRIPVVQDTLKFTTNPTRTYHDLDGLFGQDAEPIHLRSVSPLTEQLRPQTVNRSGPAYQGEPTKFAFAEAFRFYNPSTPASSDQLAPPPPPQPPPLEFHNVCGFLADYPELLRRLGLVIDVVVSVPAGITEKGSLRVEFTTAQPQFNKEQLRPWTLFRYVPTQSFTAETLDGHPVREGWLSLSGKQWSVTDLDLDGSALKAVNFVDLIHNVSSSSAAEEQLGTGPAALQGAGITVFCDDRDAWLATGIGDDSAHKTGGTAPELTAAQLVRGYRIDVATVSTSGALGPWRSLCRRKGSYTIRRAGQPPFPIAGITEDEGFIKSSTITRPETTANELYVHQALFGWDGWSLVAPLPGKTLNRHTNEPEAANPPVSKDFPLDTKFVPVPGSLPALRYGRTYRLRARVVDLAANSVSLTTTAPQHALSEPIVYSRWEPVPPPVVVPRKPFNEGESVQCLVIRSTVTNDGNNVSTAIWAAQRSAQIRDHNDPPLATDGLSRRYVDYDERHIAPPKSALQMAERHGMYDDAIGGAPSDEIRKRFLAAATREAGTFLDTKVSRADNPDFTRDLLLFKELAVAKHDAHDPTPVTVLPIERGAGLKTGEFVVHTADELLLPYLPDVLARSATFYGLPGAPPVYSLPFYDDFHKSWPDAAPFRLRIEEGHRAPQPFGRQLIVYLPQAEVATARLSCKLNAADLKLFRLWNLLTSSKEWQNLNNAEQTLLTQETVAGLNWMLTPYIELRLVHAVEKPLTPPELRVLKFERDPEQNFVTLADGILRSHAKSTGQVDIDATWQEWVDDPTEPVPHRIHGHAHVATVNVELTTRDPDQILLSLAQPGPIRHTFGDTKHRNVSYQPTATTRFREYFHPSITNQPELITRTGELSTGPAGQGWPIPSSRRPEPPSLAYLLPTFSWTRTADRSAGRVRSLRDGAGIRVYLNRPWFFSGDDELLAVTLDPTPTNPLLDQLTTRWGTDPVWSDTTVLPAPAATHFPHPAATVPGLRLIETSTHPTLTVSAVAYQPTYDPDKRLWYCDIDLDLGTTAQNTAYFPYLRLALARYQPHSVTGLELSKIVLAEFTQPVPRRTLVVQQTPRNSLLITTSGPAASNDLGKAAGTGLPAIAASHLVTATIQQRDLTSDNELDWQPTNIHLDLTCQTAGSAFTWTGELPPSDVDIIPSYRLLVEEYERYTTDPATADLTITIAGRQIPVGHRLTYADTIPLTTHLRHLTIDFDHQPNP
jgi:hypothetical protein